MECNKRNIRYAIFKFRIEFRMFAKSNEIVFYMNGELQQTEKFVFRFGTHVFSFLEDFSKRIVPFFESSSLKADFIISYLGVRQRISFHGETSFA